MTTQNDEKYDAMRNGIVYGGATVMAVFLGIMLLFSGCGRAPQIAGTTKTTVTEAQGTTDPNGVLAQELSGVLAKHRKDIDDDLERVEKVARIAKEDTDYSDVKNVERLLKNADIAVANVNAMNESLMTLDRELKHARTAFIAYAQAFKDRADDYRNYENKDVLLSWASYYERLAAGVPAERERVSEFLKHVVPLLDHARESKQLLADYRLFLITHYGEKFPASEAAHYQTEFRRFVTQYEQFSGTVNAYRGKRP